MEKRADSRAGKRVRIILIGGFHYSGIILKEDDLVLTIRDKFQAEVSLAKNQIQVLEVSDGN